MQPLARHHLRTRGKSDTGATREIGAVRGVLVWAPPDEARRMPEAPAVQSAEVDLTDEGGREGNPRIKALVRISTTSPGSGGEIMALAGVLRTGISLRKAAAHSALRSFVLQPPLHPTTTMRCSTRLTSRITSVYFGADLGTVAQGGEPMGTPVTEAFSTAQACRVVGVTYRQIDYWAHSRLVTPSLQEAAGSGTRRRYSFADLVELRVVKKLIDAGVDLRRVRHARTLRRSPSSPTAAPSTPAAAP